MLSTNVCAHEITDICTIILTYVLNYFALEMAAICSQEEALQRTESAWQKGEDFFSKRNLVGMQEEHKNIVCQAILFLICFRK